VRKSYLGTCMASGCALNVRSKPEANFGVWPKCLKASVQGLFGSQAFSLFFMPELISSLSLDFSFV